MEYRKVYILIYTYEIMFISRKKFKRKKGTVTFYYVLKSVKKGNKFKLKNEMYLGDVYRIMEAVKKYNLEH